MTFKDMFISLSNVKYLKSISIYYNTSIFYNFKFNVLFTLQQDKTEISRGALVSIKIILKCSYIIASIKMLKNTENKDVQH